MAFRMANCSIVPDAVQTDAGVAGAGTLLSFIITNHISLLLSTLLIFLPLRGLPHTLARSLLQSFSDQQILTGIGIQSLALAKMGSMAPYHFFIVWLLSLLSTATNLATLLALVREFRRDPVLRWLRQGLMLVNLALALVTGVTLLQSVLRNLEPRLPIGCVWRVAARGRSGNAALSTVGTIAVVAAQGVLFVLCTWYLHSRRVATWKRAIQAAGLLVLAALGVGATVRVVLESQAFGHPPPSVNLQGPSEGSWSFGQLLAVLLLVLPVMSVVEIIRGEVRVVEDGGDAEGLVEGDLGGWTVERLEMGSQTRLWRG